jgi:hypothetical protein
MRKILLITSLLLLSKLSFSQIDTISASQAASYIGKHVVLKGTIKGAKPYVDKKGDTIMFLDIDQTYPNTQIGLTIFKEALLELKLDNSILNKKVYISGEVVLYRDKPSISIQDPAQLKIAN